MAKKTTTKTTVKKIKKISEKQMLQLTKEKLLKNYPMGVEELKDVAKLLCFMERGKSEVSYANMREVLRRLVQLETLMLDVSGNTQGYKLPIMRLLIAAIGELKKADRFLLQNYQIKLEGFDRDGSLDYMGTVQGRSLIEKNKNDDAK